MKCCQKGNYGRYQDVTDDGKAGSNTEQSDNTGINVLVKFYFVRGMAENGRH
jgi:hypothetical protein